jgi:hypothetical protein
MYISLPCFVAPLDRAQIAATRVAIAQGGKKWRALVEAADAARRRRDTHTATTPTPAPGPEEEVEETVAAGAGGRVLVPKPTEKEQQAIARQAAAAAATARLRRWQEEEFRRLEEEVRAWMRACVHVRVRVCVSFI